MCVTKLKKYRKLLIKTTLDQTIKKKNEVQKIRSPLSNVGCE